MLLDLMATGLRRQGVTEFAVMSGRPPCVKVDGSYEQVAQKVVSDDELLELLVTLGGLAYVDRLGPEPVSWKSSEDGLGVLAIKAAKREGNLHARVALHREMTPAPPPPPVQAPDAPLFDRLLGEARQKGASDLHVIAGRPVLFRIAGDLVPSGTALAPGVVEEMLLPLVPGRLAATFEKDGSCDFALEHARLGRFRVNVARQRTGVKASLRLIGHELPTLASLGLPDAIGHATHHHQGLIVLTGPTGHGKTSTLAALVNLLNTETTHHVITVEDPVEYVHPRKKALMSQREVGTHTRSFASALKASLREDPDVIVVGELRDTETVRMALSASETGHLVLATMNTPSAAKTIERLIDLFPPGDQPQVRMALAGGLRLVVSQRLVRSADGSRVFAAAEVLPGSIALWNLIRENKTFQIPSLQQRGKAMGIVRLDDSLGELVRAGQVTLDEARAFAESPDELVQSLSGLRPNTAPRKAV
jgi:twitching motility protein PilT